MAQLDRSVEVLISEQEIRRRVAELAEELKPCLRWADTVAVVALKGGMVFASDLLRALPPIGGVDFIQARSYGAGTSSSGSVELVTGPQLDLSGRSVLLIDDIADTGRTCSFLRDHIASLGARDLRLVTLLDKPSRRTHSVDLFRTGFVIPDRFVVGYGLDLDERYRNLPYIGALI